MRVPEPFNQKNELHSDDQVSRILKYLYGNQSIGLIRDEINDEKLPQFTTCPIRGSFSPTLRHCVRLAPSASQQGARGVATYCNPT